MKRIILVALIGLMFNTINVFAKKYNLSSPSGDASVEVIVDKSLGISAKVFFQEQEIVILGPIGLDVVDFGMLGKSPRVRRVNYREVNEMIYPAVHEKRSEIIDQYKEMEIIFREPFKLIFRVYDDGVAYRLKTDLEGEIKVRNEMSGFQFPKDEKVFFPTDVSFFTHSERAYDFLDLSEISEEKFASTPFLVSREDGISVLITEVDLEDYPGLYVFGNDNQSLHLDVKFPHFVLKEEFGRDRDVKPVEVAEFIAKTDGNRFFPWRVVAFNKEVKDILGNDIVFRLAPECRIDDTSWIMPGKAIWDWWNASNNAGVSFKSGVNTATYKYHIDFAADFGLEYVILDEGWSTPADLFEINPEVDIPEICRYAEEKGVGVILWVLWNALDKDLEKALDQFETWGVKGIKVDFMQRDDQWMVNYYWRVSKAAAERHLLVDFHGAYKPCGLRRAYPNMITREGVKGLEHNKWGEELTPDHDCTLPFIRQFAGPIDYTPGAMRNAEKANFHPAFTRPMSQGTRAHQLALYVVFESPLQMLADAPSYYYKEPLSMEFLAAVPSVWDESVPLFGKVGDYVGIARQNGDEWYIGAITDWDARDLEIDLSFLPQGQFELTQYKDGINADRHAEDLTREVINISAEDKVMIHLAPGGGWAAILRLKAQGSGLK